MIGIKDLGINGKTTWIRIKVLGSGSILKFWDQDQCIRLKIWDYNDFSVPYNDPVDMKYNKLTVVHGVGSCIAISLQVPVYTALKSDDNDN